LKTEVSDWSTATKRPKDTKAIGVDDSVMGSDMGGH
jgi:hypothetical protein